MTDVCYLPVTGSSSIVPLVLIATLLLGTGVLLRRWVGRGIGVAAVVAALAVAGLAGTPAEAADDDCPPETTVVEPTTSVAASTSVAPTTTGPGETTTTTEAEATTTTTEPEATTTTTTEAAEETTTTEAAPTTLVQPQSASRCVAQYANNGGTVILAHVNFEFNDGIGSATYYDVSDSDCTGDNDGSVSAVWSDGSHASAACNAHFAPSNAVSFNGVSDFAPAIPDEWYDCRPLLN